MISFIKKLFMIESMLPASELKGELPTSSFAYKNALHVAWPSMVESVLTSLISSIDMMMVGTLGTAAIASIGLTTQPRFILLAFIFSLNAGVTAVVARRKGEKNQESANKTLRQAIMVCFVASLLLSIIGYTFAEELVLFAGAKPDTVDMATQYFKVLCCGLVFNALSMTINSAQRGAGNTKISMTTNVTANIVNVIFNFLLIGGNFGFPKLGVIGAALASDLGFVVACFMSFRSILKKDAFLSLFYKVHWNFDKNTMGAVYKVSSSAFVEQIFFRIGFFINSRIIAELGTIAFATYQIGMQAMNLSFMVADGLAVAGSALVGQSLGAERDDLARIYGHVLQRIAFVLSTFLFVIFFFGRYQIVQLFDKSPEVLESGAIIMIIISLATHLQTSQVVITGCLRGAGDTKFVAKVSMLSTAIIRPLLTFVFCFPLGFEIFGSWIALWIDQFIRLSFNFARFKKGEWLRIRL